MRDRLPYSTQTALTHVAIARRCGSLVESCGKLLQAYNDELLQEDGRTLEKYGKFIECKVDELLMYLQLTQIENFYSKDLARQVVQVQTEIGKAYSQALTIYVNSIDRRIKKFSQGF